MFNRSKTLLCRLLAPGLALFSTPLMAQLATPPVVVSNYNYHGWTNAILLGNGQVEAVVVPDAGRVMQFRFAGSTNGPFWENSRLYGKPSSAANWSTTGAIGGDKSWPAPQSDWGTGWPPPTGFDGTPYTYGITNLLIVRSGSTNGFTNTVVTISSPIDSGCKIQITRFIQLDLLRPVMRIRTVFQRFGGATRTNPVSVWTITQVADPAGIFVPVPAQSVFAPADYFQLGRGLPAQFTNANGLISLNRDPAAQRHLGFDADSLVWVGGDTAMRIDAPRAPGLSKTNYPNGGCNTVFYGNNGTEAPYVELECFGPLTKLAPGQTVDLLTTYTLFHRTETNPEAEARKVLTLSR
jgi:hypothetical protein